MDLDHYLTKNGITTADFALLIGVEPESVRRYRKTERFPEPQILARIALATNNQVTANDFIAGVPIPKKAEGGVGQSDESASAVEVKGAA